MKDDYADLIYWALSTAFKTITPWKRRPGFFEDGRSYDYNCGWNDCIKEIKKNRVRYLKNYDEKIRPHKLTDGT